MKRLEYIKVHVFNNSYTTRSAQSYLIIDFVEVFIVGIFSILLSLWNYFLFNLFGTDYLFDLLSNFIFFFCVFFFFIIICEESAYSFVELSHSFTIIDPTFLIHEIIHGYIYEKVQGLKKWEVWIIDRKFWCLGYVPENVRFPNYILKSMIGRLIHLIHDLIPSFISNDIIAFFEYIREFLTEENNWIKEIKTQIKARKS